MRSEAKVVCKESFILLYFFQHTGTLLLYTSCYAKILTDLIPIMAPSCRWRNWSLEGQVQSQGHRRHGQVRPEFCFIPTQLSLSYWLIICSEPPWCWKITSVQSYMLKNPTGRSKSYSYSSLELCNHFCMMELVFRVLGVHGGSWGMTWSQTFCLWILDFRTQLQSLHQPCLLCLQK